MMPRKKGVSQTDRVPMQLCPRPEGVLYSIACEHGGGIMVIEMDVAYQALHQRGFDQP